MKSRKQSGIGRVSANTKGRHPAGTKLQKEKPTSESSKPKAVAKGKAVYTPNNKAPKTFGTAKPGARKGAPAANTNNSVHDKPKAPARPAKPALVGEPEYFAIYKPFGMLSQFSRETATSVTLADMKFTFPNDVYPVGRLDKDSEGLLILTNDTAMVDKLLNPKYGHKRTYLCQVEGIPTKEALQTLRDGMEIAIDGKVIFTQEAEATLLKSEPPLPERTPPIRKRANIPTSWIRLTLTEGKNHQVRKMTAGIGFPTLRLVRSHVKDVGLEDLQPGEGRKITLREIEDLKRH